MTGQQRIRGSIVLVGFMGSGKSSIGRLVARMRKWRFVDTDQIVAHQCGDRTIPAIFEAEGEEYFRDQETKALEGLVGQDCLVIATGGGVVLREINRELLQKIGFVVWLTASEETIYERVSRNQERPLLQTGDPRQTVRELLARRRPLYEAVAHCVIDSTGMKREVVARMLVTRAQQYFLG